MKDILIVEDDRLCRRLLEKLIDGTDYSYLSLDNGNEALQALMNETFKVVLTDIQLPGANGRQILEKAKELSAESDVIVLTAYGCVEEAVKCIKQGAYDYITKPYESDKLLTILNRVFEKQALVEQTKMLRNKLEKEYCMGNIIGKSKAMQDIYALIKLAAESVSTVLVTGESGTGKELIANSIHYNSLRRRKPMVRVNCPGIPEGLIESELFGHERGAFTSAHNKRIGKFEESQGGTIFLDEIAELHPHVQTKLLRVLEDHTFERIGSNKKITVNVRVIAATNRDLERMMKNGLFREDLFWRLNVLPIHVPPLRDRKEDIPLIAEAFIWKITGKKKNLEQTITRSAIERILDYNWPGNVRELENTLERALLLSNGKIIEPAHLPPVVREASTDRVAKRDSDGSLETVVRKTIHSVLKKHAWNKTRAAKELGIDRTSLIRKIKKFNLDEKV
jgi:two-component system response regulator AtoC